MAKRIQFTPGLPPYKRGFYVVKYWEQHYDQLGSWKKLQTKLVFRMHDGHALRCRDEPSMSEDSVVAWATPPHPPDDAELFFSNFNGWVEASLRCDAFMK